MATDLLVGPILAAQALGISVTTLYGWERAGRIEPVRASSGLRRYKAADVEALADQVGRERGGRADDHC